MLARRLRRRPIINSTLSQRIVFLGCVIEAYFSLLQARIIVQSTIYRRLRIGQDSHPDQSDVYNIS